jgi:site-specific DNA-cytosine methylase
MEGHLQLGKALSALTGIEIRSGAGRQAIGLEQVGFDSLTHVEYDRHACATLRLNRPNWNVVEDDGLDFSAKEFMTERQISSLESGLFSSLLAPR